MFTIDLLKGRGIPARSGPQRIVFAAAAFAVPVLVAISMSGLYLCDGIAISVQRREMLNYEKKTSRLSEAVELRKSLEAEKNTVTAGLSEVSASLSRHSQWSPVLAAVVENMPDSMVLTNLELEQRFVRMKTRKRDDPRTEVDVSVPVRILRIAVGGNRQSDYERAVRDFRDRLRLSSILRPRLDDIRVARGVGRLEGQEAVSYEIECVFKPGL
ncbi:MAG: hypothetical protein ACYS76_06515 [Planctomycetota bacterium]|jgi:hypothetical protein